MHVCAVDDDDADDDNDNEADYDDDDDDDIGISYNRKIHVSRNQHEDVLHCAYVDDDK